MTNEYIIILYYIMWGLLVFTVISFLISGLDDLFIDVYYWIYYSWRVIFLRKAKKLSYNDLTNLPEKRIAIMVACWHEAGVIEEMLRYNVYSIDYENYDLFVGVYPNDPNTVKAVTDTAKLLPHIKCVINTKNGPTNKSDNLNRIYSYIAEYEKEHNIKYEIFVLHDSEDIIHALSLKLYNYLMPKNAMVQIPIFPLDVDLTNWTHWTYAAEFSEIHTKDIIVREQIGGLVPSAGVGTGFTRETLSILKEDRGGVPFSTNTLTEDYNTALQIRLHKLRQIFALQYVYRTVWKKRWYSFGKPVAKIIKEPIATRALFPMEYMKSVRQKTRWILGITFQEWVNTGWKGNIATLYTLLHDRKSIFTHLITGLFFITVPFWIIYNLLIKDYPDYPSLQDLFDKNPWVWTIIVFTSFFMLNRALQRMIAVWRIYGFIPSLYTIPLILYANIINLHALIRAYSIFLFGQHIKGTSSPAWDKTDHEFAIKNPLGGYNLKLGDLLVENNYLTREQLQAALTLQNVSGKRLGDILVSLQYITQSELSRFLAKQYGLKTINKTDIKLLPLDDIPYLNKAQYEHLIHEGNIPIKVNGDVLQIAIKDPSNDVMIASIIRWTKPYKPEFVLIKN